MWVGFVKMHNRLPLGVEGNLYADLHQVEAILRLLLSGLGHIDCGDIDCVGCWYWVLVLVLVMAVSKKNLSFFSPQVPG